MTDFRDKNFSTKDNIVGEDKEVFGKVTSNEELELEDKIQPTDFERRTGDGKYVVDEKDNVVFGENVDDIEKERNIEYDKKILDVEGTDMDNNISGDKGIVHERKIPDGKGTDFDNNIAGDENKDYVRNISDNKGTDFDNNISGDENKDYVRNISDNKGTDFDNSISGEPNKDHVKNIVDDKSFYDEHDFKDENK